LKSNKLGSNEVNIMTDILEKLRLIETSRICLHESIEKRRLECICREIQESRVLSHPPLAIKLKNGQYLVIDGAHRTLALKTLGYKKIPVQVVEENQYSIGAWEHLVSLGDWFEHLQMESSIRWETKQSEEQPIVEIIQSDMSRLMLYQQDMTKGLFQYIQLWHLIVDTYTFSHDVNRQPKGSIKIPLCGTALIRFPSFKLEDLEKVVENGYLLPAGVTRFEIEGRLLNLYIPLEVLNDVPFIQESWQQLLTKWRKKIRHYSKGVYLCE
jgi:hypothetical protein